MVVEGDQVPFPVLRRRVVQRAQIMAKQRVRRGVLLQIPGQGRPPPIDRSLDSRQLVEFGLDEAAREIGLSENRGTMTTQGLQLDETMVRIPGVGVYESVALELEQESLLGVHGLLPPRLGSRPAPIVVCLGPGPDHGA